MSIIYNHSPSNDNVNATYRVNVKPRIVSQHFDTRVNARMLQSIPRSTLHLFGLDIAQGICGCASCQDGEQVGVMIFRYSDFTSIPLTEK